MCYTSECSLNENIEQAANLALCKAMLGKNGSSWFAARMREHTSKIMLKQERQWKHQMKPRQPIDPAMPQELPATQLSLVLIGTVVWWLESETSYTPGQVAAWFYRFAFYGYLSSLGYDATLPK